MPKSDCFGVVVGVGSIGVGLVEGDDGSVVGAGVCGLFIAGALWVGVGVWVVDGV
jgi:hypothetical protein